MVAVHGVVVAGGDEGGKGGNATAEEEAEAEKDKTDASLTRFRLAMTRGRDIPGPNDASTWVYEVGCIAKVLQLTRVAPKDGTGTQFSMLVEGIARCRAMQ